VDLTKPIYEDRLASIDMRLTLLTWLVGFNLALSFATLLLLLTH